MSYPPLSGYGSYGYNPDQNPHPSYGSSRQSENTTYGQQYQQNERQQGYGSSGYEWQGQTQTDYGSHSQQQSYQSHSWKDTNGQGGQYDYRRDASSYATQAATGNNAQGYHGNTNTTQTGQSLQALNSLAYASGLDNQRQPASANSKSSIPSHSNINRTQSPIQPYQRQQYSTVPATSSGTSSPQLAISAAQALAGAVSRKYQQSGGSAQKSTSPAMSNAPSANTVQRTSSPYSDPSNAQGHARGSSSQSQNSYSQPPAPKVTSSKRKREPSGTQTRNTQKNRTSNQRSAASQSSSISNLVSTSQDPQSSSTVAADSMPTYIDPTQVFNPYHKEHERRRKDAAEAEIRRKEEEAAAAAAAATAQINQKRKEALAAKAAKARQAAAKEPPAIKETPKATSPEDDMANEMKRMMERMKEFRSKDPSTFQKLWEDMRKGGGAAATSSAPAASTSPQVSQGTVPSPVQQATSSTADASANKPRARRRDGPSAASAIAGHHPQNGYTVIVEDNDEGLADSGRFPAERRIRTSYAPKMATPAHQMPSAPPAVDGPIPNRLLPLKTASGGVEWPRDKRDALAAAAINALSSNHENEKIGVTPADIHNMLEQNPSYIQLCDLLEKKGLRFHRGQFARQLLGSVPDLTTPPKGKESAQPAPTPRPAPPPMQQQPPAAQRPPPQKRPPPGPPMSQPPYGPSQVQTNGFLPALAPPSFQHLPYQHPLPCIPHVIKNEHFQTQKPPPPRMKKSMPLRPEPPPGSKEAMARKRDFSELVDLTQLSDNDDYVLSSKHARVESPSPDPDPFAAYTLQQQLQANAVQPASVGSNVNFELGAPLRFNPTPATQSQLSMRPPQLSAHPSKAPVPPPPPERPQKTQTILARKIAKGEALRKSYYDPKTVARDILVAAGRHPSERPLNAHMAGLLGNHIELDSDLSTFDWDAIDPGGPPAPKVVYVDIPAGPPRFQIGEHARSPRGRPPRAEAESRLPNSAKADIQERPAPGPPLGKFTRSSNADVKTRSELKPSRLRQSHAVDDQSPAPVAPLKRKPSVDSSPGTNKSLRSSSDQPRASMEKEYTGALYPSGKRRGRPVGSKNRHASVTHPKKVARTLEPQVEIPAPNAPRVMPTFRCKWRQCRTELHNLDTLRRHVARVHVPTAEEVENHDYVCWWSRCRYQIREGDQISISPAGETEEQWMQHIEEDHLHPIAMKLGDGPSAVINDPQTQSEMKARYLSDAAGKITTPPVPFNPTRNKDLPQDALSLTRANGPNAESDMYAQKSFLKAHRDGRDGKVAVGGKLTAEEVLRAMERRKGGIGWGIERGGCTLVNEERRGGWVQSPGVRRVVEGDY